jgi:hypothetical protein
LANIIISEAGDGAGPMVYWSFAIAALSFIWSVVWSYWTFRRATIQGYWFNEVVGPRTIGPLMDFSSTWLDKIRLLSGGITPQRAVNELSAFGESKDAVLGELWVSRLLFDDVYDFACEKLDEFEDQFGEEISRICAHHAGANVGVADFADLCRKFEEVILQVLGRIASAKARISR